MLFNRLKFSTAQAYFITFCDGLKFDDSTADVTDDAQLTAHERNPRANLWKKDFCLDGHREPKTAVGEDGCCDKRCHSCFEFYKYEVISQMY